MTVVILGAGTLGKYVAEHMAEQKQNVVLIDQNPKALESFEQTADIATSVGSGMHWQFLQEIAQQNPVLFIAMTGSDATNLASCALAKSLEFPKAVARISDPSFLDQTNINFHKLFLIDYIINPSLIVAKNLVKNIFFPVPKSDSFCHGNILMGSFEISEDKNPEEILKKLGIQEKVSICLVHRKDAYLFPMQISSFEPSDVVTFIGEARAMMKLASSFLKEKIAIKNAIIIGGSQTTFHLAPILHAHGVHVKIIEERGKICRLLAEKLPFATILHHDPTDLNFLKEERIEHFDIIISCSSFTEKNILSSTLANELGAKKIVTVLSDMSYSHLLKPLGISSVVSEKSGVAEKISSILHSERLVSLKSIYENQIILLEMKLTESSNLVNKSIKDLSGQMPAACFISLIEHQGEISIAKEEITLAAGDTIFIFSTPNQAEKIKGWI